MRRAAVAGIVLLGAAGCAVARPAVVTRSEEGIALANEQCRLELDEKTGEVVALKPHGESLRGQWFEVIEEDRQVLEPWETWEHGTETSFTGGPTDVEARVEEGIAKARMSWERPNGLRVVGEIRLEPDEAGPRFRVTIENRTGEALVDTIHVPILRGIRHGDADDDWFTWPHTLGSRFRVRGFEPGETLRHAYPDFMYMQWLDLYDDEQGLYVGCLDDYGYSKELFIGRDDDGASLMGVTFVGCWVAEAGDSWTTPWVQVAGHAGDWRGGADLYRPFAQAAFGPLDPPQRVWDMPTANCWLAHHASDGDVGKLFEVQQQAPIHASYLMKSLNTSVPEGWDGFRGSALEYEEAFARIRELGGSPALFTFDRAPLMGRPNYAEYTGRWTSQRRDRGFAEGFRDMMPSPLDPSYVRARVGEAARWVQAFGLDEIHLDTAATTDEALAGPSYHPGTPQRPNEVPHYFKALYRAIRDECRKHNPEFLLRAEHCADFFMPEFLTSTAHFFVTGTVVAQHNPPADAQLMPDLFRTTLPQHAALQMPSQSASDFWTYGYGMGHGFHGGGASWCFNPGVREAETPPGELLHRYRFYADDWLRYYDFRVGLTEAVIEAERSETVAEALIDGEWVSCDYPGPVVAVTHLGDGLEATLGQWYHLSETQYYGERFVGEEALEPRPIRLRVPTRLKAPRVMLYGDHGVVDTEVHVADGVVEVGIPDPTVFALAVAEGPVLLSDFAPRAHTGETLDWRLTVLQDEPQRGELTLDLPAGWPEVEAIAVPARASWERVVRVVIPKGIFGRCYPLKAVLRLGETTRTTAGHVLAIEPLTVLYGFEAAGESQHCVEPGKRARLTVTCVNNTGQPVDVGISVSGGEVAGTASGRLEGASYEELTNGDSALRQWTEGKADTPGCALVSTFEYDCAGAPTGPTSIRVLAGGKLAFEAEAYPRTRVMDLDGEWKVQLTRASRAQVGGAERHDALDTEAVTPDVWDGDWETMGTPIRLAEDARKDSSWGIYRRLVYVPEEWRGADVWLRLTNTGAPWGHGGTLNLVYVNGWPSGRVGDRGECSLTSFLVFGGWNLLAIASQSPNSLVDPYLFVRDAPAPERIQVAEAWPRPEGAFLSLGARPTGQGMGLVFIKGVVEGRHRRTDVATGGENRFIYLTVADAFLRDPEGPVEVLVQYLDEGTSEFGIAYDSTDETAPINGAFKDAPPCRRGNTGEWKTHTFALPDAKLANRQHLGADLRLWAEEEDVRVRRVEVRRVAP